MSRDRPKRRRGEAIDTPHDFRDFDIVPLNERTLGADAFHEVVHGPSGIRVGFDGGDAILLQVPLRDVPPGLPMGRVRLLGTGARRGTAMLHGEGTILRWRPVSIDRPSSGLRVARTG